MWKITINFRSHAESNQREKKPRKNREKKTKQKPDECLCYQSNNLFLFGISFSCSVLTVQFTPPQFECDEKHIIYLHMAMPPKLQLLSLSLFLSLVLLRNYSPLTTCTDTQNMWAATRYTTTTYCVHGTRHFVSAESENFLHRTA